LRVSHTVRGILAEAALREGIELTATR